MGRPTYRIRKEKDLWAKKYNKIWNWIFIKTDITPQFRVLNELEKILKKIDENMLKRIIIIMKRVLVIMERKMRKTIMIILYFKLNHMKI